MVKERQPDVRTVLVANPDWWGDNKSNVTEGIFTPIGQDATRVAALISGDVDMAYPIPVQGWKRLDEAEGVRPLTGPEARPRAEGRRGGEEGVRTGRYRRWGCIY